MITVEQGQHGQAQIGEDGKIHYTPNPDVYGSDSLSYTISDGENPPGYASAIVRVNIHPVNDAPLAVDDLFDSIGRDPVILPVTANDSDKEDDPLTIIVVEQPLHGDAVINGPGEIKYTPAPGYTGTDQFNYTISDGQGGMATARVTIHHTARFYTFLPCILRP